MPSPNDNKLLPILESNWQAEMSGYYTYQALAVREPDPHRKVQLRHLAKAELGIRSDVGKQQGCPAGRACGNVCQRVVDGLGRVPGGQEQARNS